ncbi:hypothetical protein [Gordonia alkanivorans]|uniref:hypothetical protein n=1 Tax=Gordonia alkanivorans TaxID=84096 RepID=UPI0024B74F94|nr:hypothetical protein [Gordonia alkanivorans]MDJ0006472.1 hypothetical protein [Gordonia alkanivorans]MDJ0492100.1 hypothetical protein [Gordonia alkanivorans]
MSAGAVELIRSIRELHPTASVNVSVQPNPEPDDGAFAWVSVIGLPTDQYPEFRRGEFGDDHVLTVRGPDRRDSSATLSVTRYHDDNVDAALQTALDYITAQAGAGQ